MWIQSAVLLPLFFGQHPVSHAGSVSEINAAGAAQSAIQDPGKGLLVKALEVANAMPMRPHVKSRSRAQELVFITCMELDQIDWAAEFAPQISNWRKGTAFGDIGLYYAERGLAEEAVRYRKLANQVVDESLTGPGDEWRRERVESKIARLDLELSRAQEDSNALTPIASPTQPALIEEEVLAYIATVKGMVRASQLDVIRRALDVCVTHFDEHYANRDLRNRIEAVMKSSWEEVPGLIRVELAMSLVDVALRHKDLPEARRLVADCSALMSNMRWEARYQVPMVAELAKKRIAAGQESIALEETRGGWELYNSRRESIVNIYRAETVVPLAEAFLALGEKDLAHKAYTLAISESQVNPNSRPRAEDLTMILCSMAKAGCQGTEAIQARIRKAVSNLDDPW